MFEFILKKNEIKQLEILAVLVGNFVTTKTELDQTLNMVPASSFRYLRRIDEDLARHPHLEDIHIDQTGNLLAYVQPPNFKTVNVLRTLAEQYLSESTPYKLLILLKQSKENHFKDLTEKLNISDSYLHKLIKELNIRFEPAKISLKQRNKILTWHGPAENILFMKYYILYFTQIFDINFSNQFKQQDFKPLFNFSNLNNLETDRLQNFSYLVTKNSEVLADIRIQDSDCYQLLFGLYEAANLLANQPTLADKPLDAKLYLNLFMRSIVPDIDSPETKIAIAKKWLADNNDLTQRISQILNDIFEKFIPFFPVDSDPYYIFLFNAHIELIYTKLLGSSMKKYFKMDNIPFKEVPPATDLLAIETYFQQIPYFNHGEDSFYFNENKDFFIMATHTLIRTLQQPKVNILLDFVYQPGFKMFVYYKLISVFNPEVINFIDDPEQADLIITDYAVATPPSAHLYVFLDVNSKHAFNNLFEGITTLINTRSH